MLLDSPYIISGSTEKSRVLENSTSTGTEFVIEYLERSAIALKSDSLTLSITDFGPLTLIFTLSVSSKT